MTAAVLDRTAGTVVRYEPKGAGRELFTRRDSELVISGPAGTGKSTAALFRVHLAALGTPGIRCLIARKTAVSLGSTTLVSFEKNVAAEALAAGVVQWFGGSTREAASYRYANGSTVVVGGLDKPEKVLSSEYDLVFVDEATELTETDWETLSTRLRNGRLSWQQQIAACNPDRPTHWLKARCDRGAARMLYSRHEDNPYLYGPDGELTAAGRDYMAKLENLTGVRRLRLRDGQWAAAEGLVYESWDPAVHLVDVYDVPAEWPRFWSIDFGYVNPFVCQWWAQKPDGDLVLYRELVRTRTLVEDHARHIAALSAAEPHPQAIICDHDAEDRATLERHIGYGTKAAVKTVRDGIQAVESRLRAGRITVFRNAVVQRDPALDEFSRPQGFAEEISGYVWLPPVNGRAAKEEPLKENDHAMDAARYLVAHRDGKTHGTVRWL
jgi:phage terminase large subunit